MEPAREGLLRLLVCPSDHEALERRGQALVCASCRRRYPVDDDGIVSFLPEASGDAASWDEESESYAAGFNLYTEAVEVPATVERLQRPAGPVMDHGAGTGRMTSALQRSTGQPVIALDYSRDSLRRLLASRPGVPVLAVHADVRQLPLRDAAMAAVCSAGVHPLLRASDRQRMLAELARVLPPGGPMVLSTLNYSWVFRAWSLKGNPGAREGENLHGRSIYYHRFTPGELRDELAGHFTVNELVGVRNLPARSLASALRSSAGARIGGRLAGWVERYGPQLDRQVEHLPVSRLTGFLLVVRATRRPTQPAASGSVSQMGGISGLVGSDPGAG